MTPGNDDARDDGHDAPADDAAGQEKPAERKDGALAAIAAPSSLLASVVALLALVAYGIMLHAMYGNVTEKNEVTWARMHELFTGIETIAFAAAGFFFGREVNRARAEVAERRATQSERKAADATDRGRELTRDIKDLVDAEPDDAPKAFGVGPGGPSPALRRLAERAESYFPPPTAVRRVRREP